MLLLVMGFTTGCAVRYPALVPMREQQFRSHDQAVALPLDEAARAKHSPLLQHDTGMCKNE
jgi:hypothetical protein